MKIGAVTVGQSPREDVTNDILPILGPEAELIQRGALDNIRPEEYPFIAPEEGDYVLVSCLRDGSQIRFAERKILPNLQKAISELEQEGVSCILMLCTGKFPDSLYSHVCMIYPCDLLTGVVPVLTRRRHIAVIMPDESQFPQGRKRWEQLNCRVTLKAASPYGDLISVIKAGEEIRNSGADLIVLDCIGYSSEMKQRLTEITRIPVILPRTLLARTAAEYLNL